MTTTPKTTKTSWKKAAVHEITLPSGTVISIKLPNLSLMMKTGNIPNGLIDAAVGAQDGSEAKLTREMIESQWDFSAFLVAHTVVDPQLTEEEVAEIPAEDIEMIVEFATRQRDIDAAYKHIGGLDQMGSFRHFRGIASGIEDLENL
jgi:hypothetical protein